MIENNNLSLIWKSYSKSEWKCIITTNNTEKQWTIATVTRFEVIDNNWRVYVSKWVSIKQSIQDDWRTLKIFVEWRWVNPQEELIPLDVEKISDELYKLSHKDEDWYVRITISNMLVILSKYGTTPQKKFNRDELEEWYKFHEDFVNWMCFDEAIEHFLATNHLLEE